MNPLKRMILKCYACYVTLYYKLMLVTFLSLLSEGKWSGNNDNNNNNNNNNNLFIFHVDTGCN